MSLFGRLVVTTLPLVPRFLVWRVAERYVAGPHRDDALDTVRRLNELGARATLDVLGEEVTEQERAEEAAAEYLRLFDAIQERGLDATVSIKLTSVGLKIDEIFCRGKVERIAAAAREHGNFVRIDMEDRSCTEATLGIYESLQPRYGNLGVVLQAYMRRTLADIDRVPREGGNVRLCKGIYIEPRAVAWKDFATVRRNFVAALDKLLRRGNFVGIATHDEYLVCAAIESIDRLGIPREAYEFQMLLGVDEELRDVLLAEGHPMRIYVPYGPDWYQYSVRRLRENPEVARHVARATLGLR